jgi:DNA-binding GntR family transcriptional regulator
LKLRRNNLNDQAAEALRQQIITGAIPPGTKLVEREVARQFGISRAPVRDALIQLEKEGLIISKPDARYVIELTQRDLRELHEVRLALEKLAVRLAAENASAPNRDALLAKLREMETALKDRDHDLFIQTDIDLHALIWKQADNQHLERTLSTMLGPIMMFVSNNAEHYRWDETLDLHRDLIACINAKRVQDAVKSIERHLLNALERTIKIFEANP